PRRRGRGGRFRAESAGFELLAELPRRAHGVAARLPEGSRRLTLVPDVDADLWPAEIGEARLDPVHELRGDALAAVGLGGRDVVQPAAAAIERAERRADAAPSLVGDQDEAGVPADQAGQAPVVVACRLEVDRLPELPQLV